MSVCHELWASDDITHVCGKVAGHEHWHMCPCGALLMTNSARKTAHVEPSVPDYDDALEIAAARALTYTTHAAMRRVEMRVSHRAVFETITDAALSYPSHQHESPGGTCFQRGDLVVVTSADGAVITLLWHGAEGRHDDGSPKRRGC